MHQTNQQTVSSLFTALRERTGEIDETITELSERLTDEQRFLQTVVTTIITAAVTKTNNESLTKLYTDNDYFNYLYYVVSTKEGAKIGIVVSFSEYHAEREDNLSYDLLREIEREVSARNLLPLVESITVNNLQLRDGGLYDFLLEL